MRDLIWVIYLVNRLDGRQKIVRNADLTFLHREFPISLRRQKSIKGPECEISVAKSKIAHFLSAKHLENSN